MGGHAERRTPAVAEANGERILATVEIAASPERVFRALTSSEVTAWWVRPGVFDTREWAGDVRPGGRWRASGLAGGRAYSLEGEFLRVDSPRTLVHTWHGVGAPGAPTTVTYSLQDRGAGTHLTLTHAGFTSPEACENTRAGWETSLQRLAELLGRAPGGGD
jgi:uncharacterized protein YndB with AHSA1/START domain